MCAVFSHLFPSRCAQSTSKVYYKNHKWNGSQPDDLSRIKNTSELSISIFSLRLVQFKLVEKVVKNQFQFFRTQIEEKTQSTNKKLPLQP